MAFKHSNLLSKQTDQNFKSPPRPLSFPLLTSRELKVEKLMFTFLLLLWNWMVNSKFEGRIHPQ